MRSVDRIQLADTLNDDSHAEPIAGTDRHLVEHVDHFSRIIELIQQQQALIFQRLHWLMLQADWG